MIQAAQKKLDAHFVYCVELFHLIGGLITFSYER
jgi:hypothetical protein